MFVLYGDVVDVHVVLHAAVFGGQLVCRQIDTAGRYNCHLIGDYTMYTVRLHRQLSSPDEQTVV